MKAKVPGSKRTVAAMPFVPPPQKLSEVKAWVAAHGSDAGAVASLAWAPGRKFATHDACIRALMTIANDAALDALSTYRGQDAGNLTDLGAAWDRFDRRAFARRVLASPVTLGARGGLKKLDGIDAVEVLDDLTVEVAGGCSLAPIAHCKELLALRIQALGDLDLGPIASLPKLDLLSLNGERGIVSFESLRGAAIRKLELSVAKDVDLSFLEGLPRLRRIQLSTSRAAADDAMRAILRGLVARGVAICGYAHQDWTAALRDIGGTFSELHGFRAVSSTDETAALQGGSFLSG